MDSLSYSYVSSKNELDHVADAVAGVPYVKDLGTQSSGNYGYNAIGQMTSDGSENISSITWDSYGKVKTITKPVTGGSLLINYRYDGAGNRVSKTVSSTVIGQTTTSQYYVYDAGGTVVAIYTQECPNVTASPGPDMDHDGVPDAVDNCPMNWNPNQEDANHNGVGDVCDSPPPPTTGTDQDGDGIPDLSDNCKYTWNPDQRNTDGDIYGDACDADIDNDGVPNDLDNCLSTWNPDQADLNGDGIGDACECMPSMVEFPVYGLSREAIARLDTNIYTPFHDTLCTRVLGLKSYELTDWLGNVRATISDIKLPTGTPGSGPYKVDFLSYMNPYPFGMAEPGRTWDGTAYRYGYNGMERDDEVKGMGNSYFTEYRMFDPRIGRWMSPDPAIFPGESVYTGLGNNPILFTDRHGRSLWDDIGAAASGAAEAVRDAASSVWHAVAGSNATPLEPATGGIVGTIGSSVGAVGSWIGNLGGGVTLSPTLPPGEITIEPVEPSWEWRLDENVVEPLAKAAQEASKDLGNYAISQADELVEAAEVGASAGGQLGLGCVVAVVAFFTPTPISDGYNLSDAERDLLSHLYFLKINKLLDEDGEREFERLSAKASEAERSRESKEAEWQAERDAGPTNLIGIPGATRLREDEQATAARLQVKLGIKLRESPHEGSEYIDEAGKYYDALGGGERASKYFRKKIAS